MRMRSTFALLATEQLPLPPRQAPRRCEWAVRGSRLEALTPDAFIPPLTGLGGFLSLSLLPPYEPRRLRQNTQARLLQPSFTGAVELLAPILPPNKPHLQLFFEKPLPPSCKYWRRIER